MHAQQDHRHHRRGGPDRVRSRGIGALSCCKTADRIGIRPCAEITATEGSEMPRYYFHLRSKETFVWDREGVELPDPSMACGAAC
ncbi:DUF6894 family protein [Microvirga terrae]|uniref:DUF6894 family protein n=1 Tax=Microvirga terrae TaxID=2740529 RepID=UPI003D817247